MACSPKQLLFLHKFSLSLSCKKTLPKRDEITGGKGMNRAEEPAFAGGSSAENAPPGSQICPVCHKKFGSRQAVNGHLRMHPEERKEASILLKLTKLFPSQHAVPGHNSLSQPEKKMASVLLEFRQKESSKADDSETRSHKDTMPEDCTSPSAVGTQRKKICVEFDLNKEPPEDDENDDEDYAYKGVA